MKKIINKMLGINQKNIKNKEEELLLEEEVGENYQENESDGEDWLGEEFHEEGQLSIDVYQTANEIVIKSTIAGVKPDDIDISINNDLLTIRGKREMDKKIKEESYLFRECYWGAFSRSIILPVEIDSEKIDATLENGVLTVILPRAKVSNQVNIKVKGK